jgi:hypothetical protein
MEFIMKLLYLLKKEPTISINNMIESHKNKEDVTIIDMRTNKNYAEIIEKVFANDKIITW